MTTAIEVDQNAFGPHLMMDCRGVNYEKANDTNYIWQFLNDLPDKIGMTKIIQPYVFPYSGLVPEDKGVTGMVIIAESHLTFHSFTEKDYFFFDLFSCKPFEVDFVIKEVIKAFDVQHVELHHATRGRDFPRDEKEEKKAPFRNMQEFRCIQTAAAAPFDVIEHPVRTAAAVG